MEHMKHDETSVADETAGAIRWAPLPAALTSAAGAVAPQDGTGRVRIGAQAPVFPPAEIADAGRVRIGAQSPTF